MMSSAKVPTPPRVDPEKLRDGHHLTIAAASPHGDVLVHFDPATNTGAILYRASHIWQVTGPIGFGEFTVGLAARGIVVSDGDDLARWVLACTPAVSADAASKH